jgi:hypothetical protein
MEKEIEKECVRVEMQSVQLNYFLFYLKAKLERGNRGNIAK